MRTSKRTQKNTTRSLRFKNLPLQVSLPAPRGLFALEKKMPNANTPGSKKARQREADNRKARIVAAGGKRKTTLLAPEAHAALISLTEKTGKSETAIINAALIALDEQ